MDNLAICCNSYKNFIHFSISWMKLQGFVKSSIIMKNAFLSISGVARWAYIDGLSISSIMNTSSFACVPKCFKVYGDRYRWHRWRLDRRSRWRWLFLWDGSYCLLRDWKGVCLRYWFWRCRREILWVSVFRNVWSREWWRVDSMFFFGILIRLGISSTLIIYSNHQ